MPKYLAEAQRSRLGVERPIFPVLAQVGVTGRHRAAAWISFRWRSTSPVRPPGTCDITATDTTGSASASFNTERCAEHWWCLKSPCARIYLLLRLRALKSIGRSWVIPGTGTTSGPDKTPRPRHRCALNPVRATGTAVFPDNLF